MNRILRELVTGLALGAAVAAPLTVASCVAQPPAAHAATVTTNTVAGHRGATGVRGVPENSREAFTYAADGGAAILETDVRWTRDLRMVVLHDPTLDRTTRCTGKVEAITYAALRTCATAAEVPTFASVLRTAYARGVQVDPELKQPATGRPLSNFQAHEYVERIAQYGMTRRTVVSSFDPAILALVKRQPQAAGLRYALITGARGTVDPAAVKASGSIYVPRWDTLTKAEVDGYHAAGIKVWAWPARSAADYTAMRQLGVDVILADDPAAAKTWLRAH